MATALAYNLTLLITTIKRFIVQGEGRPELLDELSYGHSRQFYKMFYDRKIRCAEHCIAPCSGLMHVWVHHWDGRESKRALPDLCMP
jgi:hypothetical protein